LHLVEKLLATFARESRSHLVFGIPIIGLGQSRLQWRSRAPAELRHAGDVEKLTREAFGLRRMGDEIAAPSGGLGAETGQFQDAQILAETRIDRAFVGLGLEEKHDRVGEIVAQRNSRCGVPVPKISIEESLWVLA
jgi:hypothetical protein